MKRDEEEKNLERKDVDKETHEPARNDSTCGDFVLFEMLIDFGQLL